ncbi:MAG TPA: nitroreductase family protein [Candidatus Limnocylindria bacterium]
MDPLRGIRRVHQIRAYRDEDVPSEVVDRLLELARWTGSSRNLQPWHFIVVRDKATLSAIAALRPNITWLAKAPVGILIVLDGPGHEYDEGRVTERLLTGATLLGYGGGVAWFQDGGNEDTVKRILAIPKDKVTRQIVMIGRPLTHEDPRPTGPERGRKPLSELVSYERWGGERR